MALGGEYHTIGHIREFTENEWPRNWRLSSRPPTEIEKRYHERSFWGFSLETVSPATNPAASKVLKNLLGNHTVLLIIVCK